MSTELFFGFFFFSLLPGPAAYFEAFIFHFGPDRFGRGATDGRLTITRTQCYSRANTTTSYLAWLPVALPASFLRNCPSSHLYTAPCFAIPVLLRSGKRKREPASLVRPRVSSLLAFPCRLPARLSILRFSMEPLHLHVHMLVAGNEIVGADVRGGGGLTPSVVGMNGEGEHLQAPDGLSLSAATKQHHAAWVFTLSSSSFVGGFPFPNFYIDHTSPRNRQEPATLRLYSGFGKERCCSQY